MEKYNPSLWKAAKVAFKPMPFPEKSISEMCVLNPEYQANKGEFHEDKNTRHSLQTYEVEGHARPFTICWKYNYCPICKKTFTKNGTLLNNFENLAYQIWFVRGGKNLNESVETIKPQETKGSFIDALDEFQSAKVGDLDD